MDSIAEVDNGIGPVCPDEPLCQYPEPRVLCVTEWWHVTSCIRRTRTLKVTIADNTDNGGFGVPTRNGFYSYTSYIEEALYFASSGWDNGSDAEG